MAHLPEEILQEIFLNLRVSIDSWNADNSTKLATLAKCSLASKAYNRIVRPHMYFTFDMNILLSTTSLQLFLRTLLQQPYTRNLVQRFHGYPRINLCIPALLGELLVDAKSLNISQALLQRLQDNLRIYPKRVLLALMMCLCTNLRLWVVSDLDFSDVSLVIDVVREAALRYSSVIRGILPKPRPLQHLREVRIKYLMDHYETLKLSVFEAFLRLPALEVFKFRDSICNKEFPNSLKSPVKQIYLDGVELDASGLENLLLACPNLETLSVYWSRIHDHRIDYGRISEVLRRCGPQLKELLLDPRRVENLHDMEPAPLGSLQELTSLRLLEAPYYALLSDPRRSPQRLIETLPPSLKKLSVLMYHSTNAKGLGMQILEMKSTEQFKELSVNYATSGRTISP